MSKLTAPSCHAVAETEVAAGVPVIAFAGAPNVGKSTLFNAVTGARVTMGNWPGTTVSVSRGVWRRSDAAHPEMAIIDLPGAYSLDAMSPDEELTAELVAASEPPDVVVVAADAAHLARSLYLVAQLRELHLPVVVALTMVDVAEQRGLHIDVAALSSAIGCDVVAVDPRHRRGTAELGQAIDRALEAHCAEPRARELVDDADELAVEDERFSWIEAAVARSLAQSGEARQSWSDKVDRVVTAPVWGPLIFLAVMWAVFQLTTTVAAPLQDALGNFFAGPVSDGATWLLGLVGLGDTWVQGLVVDGLINGVGTVLTFVPLMAIMFVLLALLEDSGYLARAAVVTDRTMRRLGLPGRAFLPLIVGFGCNVPAISATRILPGARQRLLTALLVPFTSCTARLTVYVMIATTFFGRWAGTVVFGMYVLSIVLVVTVGYALRRTLWRSMGADALVLDLPPYQRPTLRLTASVAWTRLRGFLQTATGIIVAVVVAVWLLQAIPVGGGEAFGHVDPENSLYAALAKAIAPVFAPAGFAAWQTVAALVVGFVAKEAVLSSWAQTYGVGDDGLAQAIQVSFAQSSGGHVIPAVLAFLVFILAYTPCVATLAAQKREIGLKWTGFGVALQLVIAYALAVATFQIGCLL